MATSFSRKIRLAAVALASAGFCTAAHAAAIAYRTEILSRSPLSYLEMDETSGTTAADSSGNGITGLYDAGDAVNQSSASTALGTAVHTPDAASPSSSSAIPVKITNVTNINTIGTGSFSIEFWFNTSNITAREDLFDFRQPISGGVDLGITMGADAGADHISVFHTTAATIKATATAVTANTWHLLAVTRDGSDGAENLYLDGANVGSATDTLTMDAGSSAALAIGSKTSGSPHQTLGLLDEFAMYGSVLTPDQVALDYATGNPTPAPEPASLSLLGFAAAGLLIRRRRCR
jgi:hypothetical protein